MRHPYFAAVIFYLIFVVLWNYLRRRKPKEYKLDAVLQREPLPLDLGLKDHAKAFVSWLFLFMRVFWVKPGFYFTEKENDGTPVEKMPILVTCNNFLSVFLLARRVKPRKVHILVVDTEGINVWCSAGKGRFSASEILDKAQRAGLFKHGQKIKMILPKFSLSGVNLAELKKAGIYPVIGPLYASDVPGYLDGGKFEERINDRIRFGLRSRTFTALPTAVQFLLYFTGAYVFLLGFAGAWIVWSATALAFLYPVFLPYLPGKQFATKGMAMGAIASLIAVAFLFAEPANAHRLVVPVLFLLATSIFIGLSYTGNSAISNYSKVRKEIARFLPVVVVLYLLIIPAVLLL